MEHSGIEAYPVGLLADIKQGRLKYGLKSLRGRVVRRDWRSVRNYFNGYLAEWHYAPEGVNHYKCGKGWTKKRAIRRLGIHLAESNLLEKNVNSM